MQGLIAKKIGMTQVFDDAGAQVPVTVLEAGPCVVVQSKTVEHDGYEAVQLGFGSGRESRMARGLVGHYKKADVAPGAILREFRFPGASGLVPGKSVDVSVFAGATYVDVTGITKGRGFQGVVKRHRMGGGRAGHGGQGVRRCGSIGMKEHPARVLRGHRMAGHMGNVRRTTQNLKVVKVIEGDNLILVCGSVPGPMGGFVEIRKALKKGA